MITIEQGISMASLAVTVIGAWIAYKQWKKNSSLKKADYINELTGKIRGDKDIKEMIYLLEYEKDWYCEEFHDDDDIEPKMDKTLSYFSYICYLKEEKIISEKEFKFFKYKVEHFLRNEQLQDYFYNLYHYAKGFNAPITFYYLYEYGKRNNIFDADFYDKTSYKRNKKYHNYLEF